MKQFSDSILADSTLRVSEKCEAILYQNYETSFKLCDFPVPKRVAIDGRDSYCYVFTVTIGANRRRAFL